MAERAHQVSRHTFRTGHDKICQWERDCANEGNDGEARLHVVKARKHDLTAAVIWWNRKTWAFQGDNSGTCPYVKRAILYHNGGLRKPLKFPQPFRRDSTNQRDNSNYDPRVDPVLLSLVPQVSSTALELRRDWQSSERLLLADLLRWAFWS